MIAMWHPHYHFSQNTFSITKKVMEQDRIMWIPIRQVNQQVFHSPTCEKINYNVPILSNKHN
jgi:hypothetical protein